MDRRAIPAVVVLVVALAAAYIWWSNSSPKFDQGITVGKRAVEIEVDGLNQTRFVLSDHRGEVVIVELMTTWCPGCEAQIEVFKRLKEEIDVTIASINVDTTTQPSADWVTERGINWFVGNSPEAALTYDISYVPTVILIDKEGVIRYRGGPRSLDRLRLLVQQFQ